MTYKEPMAKAEKTKYDWTHFSMLVVIMIALVGGFYIALEFTGAGSIKSAEGIVAIISPFLAAVGTVAAGVFGYSLGSRGTTEAQHVARIAAQESAIVRQDADALSGDAKALVQKVQRITSRAIAGQESILGKRHLSVDDLITLGEDANTVAPRVGSPIVTPNDEV